jgi:hypothetical protein
MPRHGAADALRRSSHGGNGLSRAAGWPDCASGASSFLRSLLEAIGLRGPLLPPCYVDGLSGAAAVSSLWGQLFLVKASRRCCCCCCCRCCCLPLGLCFRDLPSPCTRPARAAPAPCAFGCMQCMGTCPPSQPPRQPRRSSLGPRALWLALQAMFVFEDAPAHATRTRATTRSSRAGRDKGGAVAGADAQGQPSRPSPPRRVSSSIDLPSTPAASLEHLHALTSPCAHYSACPLRARPRFRPPQLLSPRVASLLVAAMGLALAATGFLLLLAIEDLPNTATRWDDSRGQDRC